VNDSLLVLSFGSICDVLISCSCMFMFVMIVNDSLLVLSFGSICDRSSQIQFVVSIKETAVL
jgi:hypothetical protein